MKTAKLKVYGTIKVLRNIKQIGVKKCITLILELFSEGYVREKKINLTTSSENISSWKPKLITLTVNFHDSRSYRGAAIIAKVEHFLHDKLTGSIILQVRVE